MRIAFIEPHLRVTGGIRHVLTLGNCLARRGHEITYLLPSSEARRCDWMPCQGRIEHLESHFQTPFDVLVFNDEPQWALVDLFKRVAVTVYYVLGYGVMYDKPGSRESYRYPVDLRVANSTWVAERVAEEIGARPAVVPPGIDLDLFRPVRVRPVYDVLTYGSERPSKGTREVEEACRQLGVRLEKYEGKRLPQASMAAEYCRARVFAVGSYVEGFGLPGLEALACGVPLVTTDNGGCREYARHEETALVVPPHDATALAAALKRLLEDRALAARLRENGLRLVRERFSWERSAETFASLLSEALETRRRLTLAVDRPQDDARAEAERRHRAAQVAAFTRPVVLPAPSPPSEALTSIITLSWDQPYYTQKLVESVRANTTSRYELIIVDNGSREETRQLVRGLADRAQLNPENVGFAKGMNQGARLARGAHLVFVNNDVVVPPGWLDRLLEAAAVPGAAIVAPAVTAGGSFVTVRAEPHAVVREVLPFSLAPAAVCYLMPRAAFDETGGWGEEFRLGGAEDVDLCFTVWARGRRVLVDERVLLEHHSKGTAAVKIEDWQRVWQQNRELLIDRWSAAEPLDAPRDDEVEALLEALRGADGAAARAEGTEQLRRVLAARAARVAEERARMASGVAQSWRESLRQREIAVNLRRQLRAGLWKHLYRLYVRPYLKR